jgi:hypothetical protein
VFLVGKIIKTMECFLCVYGERKQHDKAVVKNQILDRKLYFEVFVFERKIGWYTGWFLMVKEGGK